MIIIIRTKEDADALSEMTSAYKIGASLTIVNTTDYPFVVCDKGGMAVVRPGTNKEIPR